MYHTLKRVEIIINMNVESMINMNVESMINMNVILLLTVVLLLLMSRGYCLEGYCPRQILPCWYHVIGTTTTYLPMCRTLSIMCQSMSFNM